MKNKYEKYLNHEVNFERFKEFVRESKVGTLNPDKNLQQAILGLIGEWGEVADILKKNMIQILYLLLIILQRKGRCMQWMIRPMNVIL